MYVYNDSTFTKTGGTIYGDTDNTPGSTENTAAKGNGHVVYVVVSDNSSKERNTTAEPEVYGG
ncbi:MAG: hypothetical protein LBF63_00500 [Treponema sp.]|nr:hypothetical protein [Treponema sp.]